MAKLQGNGQCDHLYVLHRELPSLMCKPAAVRACSEMSRSCFRLVLPSWWNSAVCCLAKLQGSATPILRCKVTEQGVRAARACWCLIMQGTQNSQLLLNVSLPNWHTQIVFHSLLEQLLDLLLCCSVVG